MNELEPSWTGRARWSARSGCASGFARPDLAQQVHRPATFGLVHVVGGRLLEQLDGVDDALAVGHRVPLDDEDDDQVHRRRRCRR